MKSVFYSRGICSVSVQMMLSALFLISGHFLQPEICAQSLIHFQYIATWCEKGTAGGQVLAPMGIATDPMGHLYIADTGNQRIQKFDLRGRFITQIGGFGWQAEQFDNPVSIRRFRLYTKLSEDVVLPFDAGHGLFDVRENCSMQQKLCAGFFDEPTKDIGVKRFGDRLSLLFGVGQAGKCRKKIFPCVYQFNVNTHFGKCVNNSCWLVLAHKAAINEGCS